MYNPKLGLKRSCYGCSAHFYDLGKRPPICPKCGTTIDLEMLYKSKRSRITDDKNSGAEVVSLFDSELDTEAVVTSPDDLIEDASDLEIGEEPMDVIEPTNDDDEDI